MTMTKTSMSTRPTRTSIAKSVGVIGGGTAGYFTALALRRRFPDLEVTLVESSRIPIIGVGEATTPPLVAFLHGFLGIDIHALYRAVRPTWKLGIHFAWGPPGGFHYPFLPEDVAESYAYDGDIARASVGALLMAAKRTPIARRADGSLVSQLPRVRLAYHLDNAPFVRFLAEQARSFGVRHRDVEIVDAVVRAGAAGDPEIAHVVTRDGEQLAFDWWIDCSGFRSFLLDKKLGSPFHSYADTLFCDRAVVADVPHDGVIKPYTLAETMDHGWCWNIPMVHEDHRGYVYSSAFATREQAVAEMKAKNPTMSEPRFVEFRSGRHEHFCTGNVTAIGNAYAFVEPLESTALHMVIVEIHALLRLLDADASAEERDRAAVNGRIGRHWDYLRAFLGLHYRFNRRLDTPFWRECRERVNVAGLVDVVEEFRARGAFSARGGVQVPDLLFGAGGLDVMLLGQHVRPRAMPVQFDEVEFQRRTRSREEYVAQALPYRDALDELARHPELLDEMVSSETGWCQELARAMMA